MSLGAHLAAWLLATLANAQAPAEDLTGTYATDTPRGAIVVRIEVASGRLVGTLDAPGSRRIVLSGTARRPYALGTISSGVDTGEFEALVEGKTLTLKLSQRAEVVPLKLQRVNQTTAAPPPSPSPRPRPEAGASGGGRRA
jgi:hypothetical protein